jgi:hypothetical protein
MNKQDLIAKIAKDTGSSKAGAAAAVDSLIDGITTSLKKVTRSRLSASGRSRRRCARRAPLAIPRPAPPSRSPSAASSASAWANP